MNRQRGNPRRWGWTTVLMMFDSRRYYDSGEMTAHITASSLARTDRLEFCLSRDLAGKNILDLGCGPGTQLRYLAEKNIVVGADAGFAMLQQARRSGLAPCQTDFEQPWLPFRDESFDIVACTVVIEHVRAPHLLLREIHRILAPEGVAVISVPNQYNLGQRLRILFGCNILAPWDHKDFKAWDYFHLHFWTWRDFREFMAQGGFRIVEAHHQEVPIESLRLMRRLTDRAYLRDWHRRHRREFLLRAVVFAASVLLRVTGTGRFAPRCLPVWFPALFTGSHLVTAVKQT